MKPMNQDVRDSLTALLAVLLTFCVLYVLLDFPDGPFSWTVSALAFLIVLAIVVLRLLPPASRP